MVNILKTINDHRGVGVVKMMKRDNKRLGIFAPILLCPGVLRWWCHWYITDFGFVRLKA